MKKTILSLLAAVVCMSINAQVIKVYKNGTLQETYTNTSTDQYRVVFEEAPAPAADPNLLPGVFTVADGKTVQFTKSNLYWDGSAFKFEANQTDYSTGSTYDEEYEAYLYDPNHVSHFSWTKTAAASYAESSNDGTNSTSDVPFFAQSKGGLTVEGTEGLYALSIDEWTYLIQTRTNASSLYKKGVIVAGKTNCLIIAPDGYDYTTNPLQTSYDATAWATAEAAGLVCLPAAGICSGSYLFDGGDFGYYWSSSPFAIDAFNAVSLYFDSDTVSPLNKYRSNGYSLRLVK